MNLAAHNGPQANFRPDNEAGESHSANGGAEPLLILRWATEQAAAVRADQFKTQKMAAKCPDNVMILAMNIVGDGSANRCVLGAGSYGKEEAARDGEVQDFRQGRASFAPENAGLGVEMAKSVERARGKERPLVEQTHITITAPSAHGEHSRGWKRLGGEVGGPVQGQYVRLQGRISAPGFKSWLPIGHKSRCKSADGSAFSKKSKRQKSNDRHASADEQAHAIGNGKNNGILVQETASGKQPDSADPQNH